MHWVTCWLALPLQRLGTKMRTSLIIHGRMEGTRQVAADGHHAAHLRALQPIDHADPAPVGVQRLVVGHAVLRRRRGGQRQRAQNPKNLIQNMITNEVIQVNEKNMPVREEASYANFVFLSNEQPPMLLNETDRRYTVIQVERRHDPGYFKAIGDGWTTVVWQPSTAGSWPTTWVTSTQYTPCRSETKARMSLITLGMSPTSASCCSGRRGWPACYCHSTSATSTRPSAVGAASTVSDSSRAALSSARRPASSWSVRTRRRSAMKRFDAYLPGQIDKDDA